MPRMGEELPATGLISGGLVRARAGQGTARAGPGRAGRRRFRLAGVRRGPVAVNVLGLDLAHRDALSEIPVQVRDELDVRAARRLHGGGTPARVLLCEDGSGGRVVVKVLRAGAGRVDGHDLAAFMGKPQQIAAVHRDLPGLSPHYVPLV